MSEGFVYCWTDKATNKLYVGAHAGTEDDGYICSSKLMLKEYYQRPFDFSRQIIAHGTWKERLKFETVLLKSANAARDPMFYNMHNGDGKFYNEAGSPGSPRPFLADPEWRKKYMTKESRKRASETRRKNGWRGPLGNKWSNEARQAISKYHQNRPKEHQANLTTAIKKSQSENPTRAMSWQIEQGTNIITIKNLKKFCRENDIPYLKFYGGKEINGYRLRKI